MAGVSAALAASREGAKTILLESSKRVGLSTALLPLILSEGLREDDLLLPEAAGLAEAGVEVRTGRAARRVDYPRRTVELSPESGGGSVGFDSLVICTGASAQPPLLRGVSKLGVFVLARPSDYSRLAAGLEGLGSFAVSGPVPLALKVGEALASRKKKVKVFCGKEGLASQFSRPVAEMIRRGARRVSLVDEPLDSILGTDRVEAVTSEGSVSTCDAVVMVPRSAPAFPEVGCARGANGGLLVDDSMSTTLRGVFAAGDAAEIRFKSGSVPARLHSTGLMGGEVAGTNAAGGRATMAASWAVEQEYFGVEFCSAGLREEEARAMELDALSESVSVGAGRQRETLVSMVYDAATHQVYGLQVAGWRASSMASAASLIVSLGLTVERLQHLESPFSPGSGHAISPIALTARKIRRLEGA